VALAIDQRSSGHRGMTPLAMSTSAASRSTVPGKNKLRNASDSPKLTTNMIGPAQTACPKMKSNIFYIQPFIFFQILYIS
jgi:hypothetical protein